MVTYKHYLWEIKVPGSNPGSFTRKLVSLTRAYEFIRGLLWRATQASDKLDHKTWRSSEINFYSSCTYVPRTSKHSYSQAIGNTLASEAKVLGSIPSSAARPIVVKSGNAVRRIT